MTSVWFLDDNGEAIAPSFNDCSKTDVVDKQINYTYNLLIQCRKMMTTQITSCEPIIILASSSENRLKLLQQVVRTFELINWFLTPKLVSP